MLPTEIQDLVRAVGTTSPHDPRAQCVLLERLNGMRELLAKGGQSDLHAYVEAAALLTEALAHPGGATTERISGLVCRLVARVEETYRTTDAPLPASNGETPVGATCPIDLKLVHDKPLGEILIQHNRVTRGQLEEALRAQRATGMRLGEVLVMLGATGWEDIHQAVRLQSKMRGTPIAREDSA